MIKLPRRTKIILSSAAALVLGFLIILPFTLNKAGLKKQIENVVSEKLQTEFKSNGELKIAFLPLPKISLNDVVISKLKISDQYQSDIKVKTITIRPRIFSLFSKKLRIAKIIFDQPEIENKYVTPTKEESSEEKQESGFIAANPSGFLNKIFSFNSSNNNIFELKNIRKVQVKNGSFTRKNIDEETTLEFSQVNFSLKNNFKSQFDVSGNMISDGEPTNFKFVIDTTGDAAINISSTIIDLSIQGEFSDSNLNDLGRSNFNGKIDANIIDLKSFLGKYVAKNSVLYRKINSNQPIRITADIENKLGALKINNIAIDSQAARAKGLISADIVAEKPNANVEFEFTNIDVDSIWFVGGVNSGSNIVALENEIIRKFIGNNQDQITNDENKTYLLAPDETVRIADLPVIKPFFDNFDLSAKIKIKTARYYGQDLQNISFDFVTKENNLELSQMSAETPSGGLISASGVIATENDITKFVGKIQSSGNDLQKTLDWFGIDIGGLKPEVLKEYTLDADLLMLPSFNVLNNLNLNINNGKNIVFGNLKIDDSAGISSIKGDLRISELNYNDYFTTDKTSPYLSSGSLLKKLLWLNSVSSSSDIALSFDNLVYGQNSFINQGFKIKIGQGTLKIYDVNLSSENIDLKGSIEADISKSPILNININSDNFQVIDDTNKSLLDGFLALPGIDEFNGKLNINIKNLNFNNWQANDISIKGPIGFGIIDFADFTLKYHGGEVKYKGSAIVKDQKIINGSLEFVGINGGEVLSDLLGIKNIKGTTNISAIVNSVATNRVEFLRNLDAEGQFIGKEITVDGFGIYDLAYKMARPKNFAEELKNPENILYGPNSKPTVLTDISGAFAIKKGNKDQFSIKTANVGINGVVSGEFDVENQSLNASANFIFISGTRQTQVPINVATNFIGKSGALERTNNFNQVTEYLRRVLGANQSTAQNAAQSGAIQR